MGHFVNSDVTAGPTPQIHAGLNTKIATYTLSETASGSVTIAMCAIPGGAEVTNCDLAFSALDTSGGGTISVQAFIGGSSVATYIQSASGSTQVQAWNPTQASVAFRLTASANLIVKVSNVSATGTSQAVISTVLQYATTEEPG